MNNITLLGALSASHVNTIAMLDAADMDAGAIASTIILIVAAIFLIGAPIWLFRRERKIRMEAEAATPRLVDDPRGTEDPSQCWKSAEPITRFHAVLWIMSIVLMVLATGISFFITAACHAHFPISDFFLHSGFWGLLGIFLTPVAAWLLLRSTVPAKLGANALMMKQNVRAFHQIERENRNGFIARWNRIRRDRLYWSCWGRFETLQAVEQSVYNVEFRKGLYDAFLLWDPTLTLWLGRLLVMPAVLMWLYYDGVSAGLPVAAGILASILLYARSVALYKRATEQGINKWGVIALLALRPYLAWFRFQWAVWVTNVASAILFPIVAILIAVIWYAMKHGPNVGGNMDDLKASSGE